MGEIRVKVRLTNAFDAMMARTKKLKASQVRSCDVEAMVDIGAIRSVIPAYLLATLGAGILERRTVRLADGRRRKVDVSDPILFELEGRHSVEEAFVLGDEVLIGQTVLESVDLLADCKKQRLVPGHPEGPLFKLM